MDNFIKNIKKKLSVDNLVDMMKESKVIDEDKIKEDDVRKTLGKLDPESLMDVDEITKQLNELSDDINKKSETSTSKKIIEAAKSTISAIQKPTTNEEPASSSENEFLRALGREDNVFNLCDDFH